MLLLVHTLLGTLLVASGTGTLNQYIERRFDAQMRRTARRPLAAGKLTPTVVLWFGVALSASVSVVPCSFVLISSPLWPCPPTSGQPDSISQSLPSLLE
jgi:heme O synthase-like polyprenyltransferase